MSVKIIPIEGTSQVHDCIEFVVALGSVCLWGHGVVEEKDAIHVVVGLPEAVRNEVEGINNIWEAWEHIIFPISCTVAYDEALDVVGFHAFGLADHVVLVDLPGQIRGVDTSITFTRDEKWVWLEGWEQSIEFFKGGESVLGGDHIIIDHFWLSHIPWGESNTCW